MEVFMIQMTLSCLASVRARLLISGVGTVLALLLAPAVMHADTAWDTYLACEFEAAADAGDCYGGASGYWANKQCDWIWEVNSASCKMGLINPFR
jgi:hypothetical protein